MQLDLDQATDLVVRALRRHGMVVSSARIVADHLVDAALCGHEFSSLPRVLAIVDELKKKPSPGDIRVVRQEGSSAHIDGGDQVAYVVSIEAIDKAIEICRQSGVAVVTASNTWFSGRLAYYVERAARQGFIAMHTTNATARVAPHGGIDRLMGTNPFAIAFPGEDRPIVIDIGTASTTWGDVVLSKTKGEALHPGLAVDASGAPTTDPNSALDGAFLPWGGHRGSALSLAIQLLGVFAGSAPVIHDVSNYGLFFMLMDPERLMPGGAFRSRVSEFRGLVQANRPAPAGLAVRLPGDGSMLRREAAKRKGNIYLDDKVYQRILALCG